MSLKKLFYVKSSPINLAVFRIVFFGYLLIHNFESNLWFSQLPKELIFPPHGMNWILHFLPINETVLSVIIKLYYVSCFLGMIGLFTRLSAICLIFIEIYIFGIPNFFGLVYHNHHLVWFTLILATCRCADVLSCDALLAKQKTRPEPHECYGLPIRFMWFLIGIIYFFPGFWKICGIGWDWALSNNFKYLMYWVWSSYQDWNPPVRIDNYPLLYKGMALAAVFFELTFIFLIFCNRFRLGAIMCGLMFHTATNLILKIPFWDLQICYAIFIDWHKIFEKNNIKLPYINNIENKYPQIKSSSSILLPLITGLFLLTGNSFYGFRRIVEGWPLACYPTFAYKYKNTTRDVEISHINDEQIESNISQKKIRNKFTPLRYRILIYKILKEKPDLLRKQRLQAFIMLIIKEYDLKNTKSIRIYEKEISTYPELKQQSPTYKKLLYELKF